MEPKEIEKLKAETCLCSFCSRSVELHIHKYTTQHFLVKLISPRKKARTPRHLHLRHDRSGGTFHRRRTVNTAQPSYVSYGATPARAQLTAPRRRDATIAGARTTASRTAAPGSGAPARWTPRWPPSPACPTSPGRRGTRRSARPCGGRRSQRSLHCRMCKEKEVLVRSTSDRTFWKEKINP